MIDLYINIYMIDKDHIILESIYLEYIDNNPEVGLTWEALSSEIDNFSSIVTTSNKNSKINDYWDYEENVYGGIEEIYTPVIDFAFDVNLDPSKDVDEQIASASRVFNKYKGMGVDVDINHSTEDGEEWIGVVITIPETTVSVDNRYNYFKAVIKLAKDLNRYS
jgi:hypothetical protein